MTLWMAHRRLQIDYDKVHTCCAMVLKRQVQFPFDYVHVGHIIGHKPTRNMEGGRLTNTCRVQGLLLRAADCLVKIGFSKSKTQ